MSDIPEEEQQSCIEEVDVKEVEENEPKESWGRKVVGFMIRTASAALISIVAFKSMQEIRKKWQPPLPYQEVVKRRSAFSLRSMWPYLTQVATAGSVILSDAVIFGTKAKPNGFKKLGKKNNFRALQKRQERQRLNGGPVVVQGGSGDKRNKTQMIQGDFQFLERQREVSSACSHIFENAKKVCKVQQMQDGSERIDTEEFQRYIESLGQDFDCQMFFTNLLQRSVKLTEDSLLTMVQKHKEKPLVFLGGVCGRTTWRKDRAIPALEAQGVTYYNPQAEQWMADLIAIETLFKALCPILLFYVDKSTRAVVSLVELANLATQGRRLVVVLHDVQESDTVDKGPALGRLEAADLNRGRAYVREILDLKKVPCFDSIDDALAKTVAMGQEYM